jgi:hypothetical protein
VAASARPRRASPNGRPPAGQRSVRPVAGTGGRGGARVAGRAGGHRLVVTLLRAGVPPTLLVDLLNPRGPDSPAILAAERGGPAN